VALEIELQIASKVTNLPDPALIKSWLEAACKDRVTRQAEICVRIVDVEEMTSINYKFRSQKKPTNVLSFPFEAPVGVELPKQILGDIVICAEIIEKEARDNEKKPVDHFAHLLVHGCLHLLGYDHEEIDDAVVMENLETEILVSFGMPKPYGD